MSWRENTQIAVWQWRLLVLADLDAMYALHVCSIAGMDMQVVKPETKDFFRSILNGRGVVIGAWYGDTLLAYGVLQHDMKPEDASLVDGLGMPSNGVSLYKLAGAAVHPAWRGRGLQKAVIRQRMQMVPAQSVLFATASPLNPISWSNLLACGFVVRDVRYLYGGHARYVLTYAVSDAWKASNTAGQILLSDQLQAQQALLQQGWRGVSRGHIAGSLWLLPMQGVRT